MFAQLAAFRPFGLGHSGLLVITLLSSGPSWAERFGAPRVRAAGAFGRTFFMHAVRASSSLHRATRMRQSLCATRRTYSDPKHPIRVSKLSVIKLTLRVHAL